MHTLYRRATYVVLTVGLALTLMACTVFRSMPSSSSSSNSHAPTIEVQIRSIATDYHNWQSLTLEPRRVTDYVYFLCRLPSDEEYLAAESLHGPFFVRVYVNDIGADAIFNNPDPVYPVGTVIVKAKLSAVDAQSADNLGIMIKREAGFNPDGGDWEYIYWEAGDIFQSPSDDLAHCQECHRAEAEDDSIFRLGSPHAAQTYDNFQPAPTEITE